MAFQFTSVQLVELTDLINSENYDDAFRMAANWAEGGEGVDATSILWFRGAADINQGVGPFSEFVRTYAAKQYDIRFGEELNNDQLQEISDLIMKVVLDHVIATKMVPPADYLAAVDGQLAAQQYFAGDQAASSASVLFLALGNSTPFYNTIINDEPGNTYDLLAAIEAGFLALGNISDWSAAIPETLEAISQNTSGIFYTVGNIVSAVDASNSLLANAYGPSLILSQILANNIFLGTINNGDVLEGTSEGDIIHGEAGDDTIIASGGLDIIDGGTGTDVVDFSNYIGGDWLYVELATNSDLTTQVTGFADPIGDTARSDLYNIEKIIGSANNDKFLVNSVSENLVSLDGFDGLNDELIFANLDHGITLIETSDYITIIDNAGVPRESEVKFINFEKIIGTNYADVIYSYAGTGDDTVDGGADNDEYFYTLDDANPSPVKTTTTRLHFLMN
ncbi:MAG: hypothetical protein GY746_12635, partial [Gammaproteobacteria bacterium]|nr:hypothetical protein [Gammaproteobacteria bacterium]